MWVWTGAALSRIAHRSAEQHSVVRFPGGVESGSLIWAPPLQPPAATRHTLGLNRAGISRYPRCRLQAGVTRPNRSDSPRCPRGPRQFYQRMYQFCQSGSYIYSGLKFTLQVDTFSRDNFVSSEIISWLFSHEDSRNPSPYLFDNCLMICCHGWYQVLNTVSSGLEQGMGGTNNLTECDCFSLKHNNAIPRWPTNLSDQHQAWQHQHPV